MPQQTSIGPFGNNPVVPTPTSVQIEGRLIVSDYTQAIPGSLVRDGNCFWDTSFQGYVTPTGQVIGRFASDLALWNLTLVQNMLGLRDFEPKFLEGTTTSYFGMRTVALNAKDHADLATANAVASGLSALLGQPVLIVDGRKKSWAGSDSIPEYRLQFANGQTRNAGEAARAFHGDLNTSALDYLNGLLRTALLGEEK